MRKRKFIASIAIMVGLLGMFGVQTATASEDKPIEVTSIRFTGENHMAYSFNTLRVDWAADNPHSGQSLLSACLTRLFGVQNYRIRCLRLTRGRLAHACPLRLF